jgi:hypothetical protein
MPSTKLVTLGAAAVACVVLSVPPGVARAENAYVPEGGTVWFKVGYSLWVANDRFAGPFNEGVDLNAGFEPGDVAPLKVDLPDSRLRVDMMDLEMRITPVDRLHLRLNVPFFQGMRFEQTGATLVNRGIGDIRAFVGYLLTGPESPVFTQARVHLKVPTTRAQFEDASVPLTEGQVDVGGELLVTWPVLDRLWLSAALQYRHRFPVEASNGRFKPGNETQWILQVEGGPVRTLWLKAAFEGLVGQAWQDLTFLDRERPFITALDQRELYSLLFGVYWEVGQLIHPSIAALALDLQVRVPLAGRDWPRGPQLFVGVAYQFNWRKGRGQ